MMLKARRTPSERSRLGIVLAANQIRYQVRLLLRTPMGIFTAVVVPLMVLIALDLTTPPTLLAELSGITFTRFLVPGMTCFAVLNACYVNVLTSLVVARESGVLKRFHGTPLPLRSYLLGRAATAAITAAAAVGAVLIVSAVFLHVTLSAVRFWMLCGVLGLGVVCWSVLGAAVSTLVSDTNSALPVAYGTILPVAFISDVFFPASAAPAWLRDIASALPVAPIARAAETVFVRTATEWPMTATQLGVVFAWTVGASLFTAVMFRWQPADGPRHRTLRRPLLHLSA
jgi:ABC-2 type transport system permease protein